MYRFKIYTHNSSNITKDINHIAIVDKGDSFSIPRLSEDTYYSISKYNSFTNVESKLGGGIEYLRNIFHHLNQKVLAHLTVVLAMSITLLLLCLPVIHVEATLIGFISSIINTTLM